ncbi:hypothetical protein Brsp06_04821 [Brucella sp. NBRC 13694]
MQITKCRPNQRPPGLTPAEARHAATGAAHHTETEMVVPFENFQKPTATKFANGVAFRIARLLREFASDRNIGDFSYLSKPSLRNRFKIKRF